MWIHPRNQWLTHPNEIYHPYSLPAVMFIIMQEGMVVRIAKSGHEEFLYRDEENSIHDLLAFCLDKTDCTNYNSFTSIRFFICQHRSWSCHYRSKVVNKSNKAYRRNCLHPRELQRYSSGYPFRRIQSLLVFVFDGNKSCSYFMCLRIMNVNG